MCDANRSTVWGCESGRVLFYTGCSGKASLGIVHLSRDMEEGSAHVWGGGRCKGPEVGLHWLGREQRNAP
jgi:hypothetical protein